MFGRMYIGIWEGGIFYSLEIKSDVVTMNFIACNASALKMEMNSIYLDVQSCSLSWTLVSFSL